MFEEFRYDASKPAAYSPSRIRQSEQETKHARRDAKRRCFSGMNEVSSERKLSKKSNNCTRVEGKWQERWHSICDECFTRREKCTHFKEQRLRLLITGHNPSTHAWIS
ncbi:hypothetical protein ABG067_001410 [Albugo candida]|uniref:Uncharacterized protein n=1 Tax=Albugo candida TaxID=65357 RepID=A0A024GPI9_9STRA|nr:unnamed protein product [Albugo candida]|eukprot:CCI48655.1 unnamed protein product [Albugo candida]